jgi:prepilin-type N-terminal cleavage/methylation domain-containing protein
MFKKMKKNEKGFTLVELIIVIAILAVMATILIPRILGNVKDANTQSQISTAKTIASEITVYNAEARIKGTATVPATLPATGTTYEVKATDLVGSLKLTGDTDFPTNTVVKILVDEQGNAFVDKQP